MPWRKGESGNPKGRPRGCGEIAVVRATLAKSLPSVIEALIRKAVEGDVQAMRLLLDRTVPPLRSEEMPVVIEGFAGSRVELVKAIVAAIGSGRLDTARGGRLIALLSPSELEEKADMIEKMLEDRDGE
jgi:hypothetical protein